MKMNNDSIEWYLKTANFKKDSGSVFSCFSCAGGSTMGYKLAGFDVIAMNEIDPNVAAVYKANHNPKYSYVCSIRDLINKKDLPEELFNLDILDGSPPCSTFSMAGSREKAWGIEKQFAEGQKKQRLDDLFFSFIELANRLQPKIIVAENVSGLVRGKAKGYVKEIINELNNAGYKTQLFSLNSASMHVPQSRSRVFFIAHRKDLKASKLKLQFNYKPILFGDVSKLMHDKSIPIADYNLLIPSVAPYYSKVKQGQRIDEVHPKGSFFSWYRLSFKKPAPTLVAKNTFMHPTEQRLLSVNEYALCSTFPLDMNWLDWKTDKKTWAMGMSVPPFMIKNIALQIKEQWSDILYG
jgi:DNA (cytosine-5)-methyltransferase 1